MNNIIDEDKLYKLLNENNFLLKTHYNNVTDKEKFILSQIESQNCNKGGVIRYFIKEDELKGYYKLEKLDWDSQLFNRNMWRLGLVVNTSMLEDIDHIKSVFLEDCSKYDIEHISCQVDSNDYNSTSVLEKLGFMIVDSIIRFGTELDGNSLNKNEFIEDDIIIREYKTGDYHEVVELASSVFNYYPNRFLNDGHFTNEECSEMYIEWTKNSLKGFADITIVSEKDKKINGFSTVKYKPLIYNERLTIAEGQLSGVSNVFRGQGINTQMLMKRLKIASRQADYYEVGTQVYNMASQRTFYKCGLKPIHSYFTFHLSP